MYEALCSNATSECPPPVITRVSPCACGGGGGGGSSSLAPAPAHASLAPLPGQAGLCRFQIHPETGPLGGGIRITILGSNLGVRADDVKRITVAEQNCVFQPERYSVSTR